MFLMFHVKRLILFVFLNTTKIRISSYSPNIF
nr:MAG TPA: hypothetical protein [Microviridae sp.]